MPCLHSGVVLYLYATRNSFFSMLNTTFFSFFQFSEDKEMMKFTRLALYEPYSCKTRKSFRAASPSLLEHKAVIERGYKSNAWGTTQYIEKINGKIRHGEEGVDIPCLSPFTFFNAEQLVDLPS